MHKTHTSPSNTTRYIHQTHTSLNLKPQTHLLKHHLIPLQISKLRTHMHLSLSLSQIPHTHFLPSLFTTSPVFLRLHFYPTSYQNFEPTNAFFFVEVNNNLTLKNFNPSYRIHDDEEKIAKQKSQIRPLIRNGRSTC